jgi:hypothetical protein
LKIKDVVFKTNGTQQYAEVLVNGKTGTRHIPLFYSVPYIKDWIDSHPQVAIMEGWKERFSSTIRKKFFETRE